MLIAMNKFRVKHGNSEAFEVLRLGRNSYRDEMGGFVSFEMLKGAEADGMILYMGLRLGAFDLHLSEHHGDCTPGGLALVWIDGLADWNSELLRKEYANNRPGLEEEPWGLTMTVTDPFQNRIRFVEGDAV